MTLKLGLGKITYLSGVRNGYAEFTVGSGRNKRYGIIDLGYPDRTIGRSTSVRCRMGCLLPLGDVAREDRTGNSFVDALFSEQK